MVVVASLLTLVVRARSFLENETKERKMKAGGSKIVKMVLFSKPAEASLNSI
jgi:hypothetical protein